MSGKIGRIRTPAAECSRRHNFSSVVGRQPPRYHAVENHAAAKRILRKSNLVGPLPVHQELVPFRIAEIGAVRAVITSEPWGALI